jgi:16S rRNA G966 N2-methylase RsmD
MAETNGALVKYQEARAALARCRRVDEAKSIRDKMEALRVYGRQAHDYEMETWAAEIKVRAIRRIGEISVKLPKAKAGTVKAGKRGGTFELPPGGMSKAETLRAAGLSPQAAHRCEQIFAIPAEEFEAVLEAKKAKRKPVSAKELLGKAGKRAKTKKYEKDRAAAVAGMTLHPEVRHGDFRKVLADVPDVSVDLIFTDPPYDLESLPLYLDLGQFAARVLAPQGSLVTYYGQSFLPEVLTCLVNSGLTFRWLLGVEHARFRLIMKTPQVYVRWKPLLWLSRGFVPYQSDLIADLIESDHPDKPAHDWAQSDIEAAYLIEKLCPDGGLVVDPFCGSGTTLRAAARLGRRWLGAEIDKSRALMASSKMKELNEVAPPVVD